MKFITENDLSIIIKPDYFDQIVLDQNVIDQAEKIAIAQASSHITQRFDTDYLYRPYTIGLTGSTIDANGRILWNDGFIYVNGLTNSVIITNEIYPGSTFSATQSWLEDDRPAHLVELTCHIYIWVLATRVEPRRVEEIRKYQYDEACKKLIEYAHGTITFPNVIVGKGLRANNQGVSVYWGSDYDTNFDINQIGYSNRPGLYGSYSTIVDPFNLTGYRPG